MITVGTTLTTFAMLDPERAFLWNAWLRNAEAIQDTHEARYFCAIQTDSRGLDPFGPLLNRLRELGGEWWTYSLDDGRTEVTQANRLRHITFGQNLVSEYANAIGATHLLHLAADCEPPSDVIPKLLEVRNGIVAAECSTYCFNGPLLPEYHPIPVTGPPMTAVCVLIEREVFKRVKWRYDTDLGMSDDPSLTYDAETLLGVPTRIRKDVVAKHYPQAIGPIETRFPGLDMVVMP
jgi:hypothetical protein